MAEMTLAGICRLGLVFLCGLPLGARADRIDDLARIHLEAIGGRQRIAALSALRATGYVTANGKAVRFTMTAARPAKVRLETEGGGRSLVQASNGEEPAWEFDTGNWPPQYRSMADASAKLFVADSEFDDPLVAGKARGYVFDDAGEVDANGKKLLRLLVTRKMTDTFAILIDQDTYFIVMRVEHRTSTGGRKMQIVTHYEDFRPVEGVLLPHLVTVALDGRISQRTTIVKIDANPVITDETFTRPKVSLPAGTKP